MIHHHQDLRAELSGSVLTRSERTGAEAEIQSDTQGVPALSADDAWHRRQRRRQEQREAAVEHMRQRAGHRPSASFDAAIRQRQNRLEHSR